MARRDLIVVVDSVIARKKQQVAKKDELYLIEVLMKDSLKMVVDEGMSCSTEHHMKDMFPDALYTILKHPKTCPHSTQFKGKCCL
jgi:Mn-dependent DtxR family transcriptional regulator